MKTNIAQYFAESAERHADKTALIIPSGRTSDGQVAYARYSFKELARLSDIYACEFRKNGITKGVKTLMMLQPGADFIAAVFAVFKTGGVPVLIDPGMGMDNLLKCIEKTAPSAMIAIPKAHWARLIFRKAFKSVKILFSKGGFPPPGTIRLDKILKSYEGWSAVFKCEETKLDDMAAIVFTTGSTGSPKGVVYTHGIYIAQLEIISRTYSAGPQEIDMPAFPLFALFSVALGMPCVIPDIDPSRPAQANPERIIEVVTDNKVTFSFGSPALWRRVAEHCIKKNIKLPTLKRVLMAGAPVSAELHGLVKKIIADDGETMIPYGATEALPIANFAGSECTETADKTAEGAGYCVGRPIPPMEIKVIKMIDGPIDSWSENLILPVNETGEIVVKGPVVTPEYYNEPEQTKNAKIADSGKVWHRMGDAGYFDEKGRLWFCGRKAHRVITENGILYSVCCEAIFNKHPKVFRTALVGLGKAPNQIPVIVVEPVSGAMPRTESEKGKFIRELLELGKGKDFTSRISQFLFHPSFPVDIRHNAKIFREKLALWAELQGK